ncbi:2-hydroxyacid dehydrogenase [Glycomyces endophyticus]|uniref:2-hydroxyacid dehydrogenase n=1 Tax=Glycomyces endophyticus TaxID=480996 RepID=A0ABP4T0T0_9ACTN
MKVWIPHEAGLAYLGDLPEDVDVEIYEGGERPSDPAGVRLLVPPGGVEPAQVFADFPALEAVQLLSAGAETWVPHMPEGIALCDNKGAHTEATAEWIQTATLASIRRFDAFARGQAHRDWRPVRTGTLTGATALIVGAGSIGESVARRFAASGTEILRIARTARAGVHTVEDLPDLLPKADVVVIIVPLTPATERLVDAAFLARMKDGALLVNAARGRVVDTDALTREVASGRLRCALDVTEPEPLPADHELWGLEGALITPHVGGAVEGFIGRVYPLVGDQIRRLAAGEPLAHTTENGY